MFKTMGSAVLAAALVTGGSVTMLGGTALASTGAAHGIATAPAAAHSIATAPAAGNPACVYTIYFMGFPFQFPCPAPASNGGTATNNCNANCSASAVGTSGKSH